MNSAAGLWGWLVAGVAAMAYGLLIGLTKPGR